MLLSFLLLSTVIVGGGIVHSIYEGDLCAQDCDTSQQGTKVTEQSVSPFAQ